MVLTGPCCPPRVISGRLLWYPTLQPIIPPAHSHPGEITLERALAQSVNTVAASCVNAQRRPGIILSLVHHRSRGIEGTDVRGRTDAKGPALKLMASR